MRKYYSYNPQKLLESFKRLKAEEEECLSALPSEPAAAKKARVGAAKSGDAVVVATVQFSASNLLYREDSSVDGFWSMAQEVVAKAATEYGANLVLIPELFMGPYFCQSQEACLMGLAFEEAESSFVVRWMQELAKRYAVMVPVSLFERHRNALYNTVIMIDADGSILGKYRKSHIPDGTGYQEKFYFTPGDTGFQVFRSRVIANLAVGVAICWDQWFPEAARAMALQGADVLLYPTAIGSEPQDPTINSADHWQRVMQGHSAANMVPVVASNRCGTEILLNDDGSEKQRITFYGRSFITDETGAIVAHIDSLEKFEPYAIKTSTIHPEANRSTRLAWGLFRDRRPELYQVLQTKDGVSKGGH